MLVFFTTGPGLSPESALISWDSGGYGYTRSMLRRVFLVILMAAFVTACSSNLTSTPNPETVAGSPRQAPSVPEGENKTDETVGGAIQADEQIISEMVCEPLSDSLLERMKPDFGSPTRSVQVKVGEGNAAGQYWWVVIIDSPPDDAYRWGMRQFLTNAQNGDQYWQWIALSSEAEHTWEAVQWDHQRLIRAESARIKAQQCLAR